MVVVSGWYSHIADDFENLTSTLGIGTQDTWGTELYYNPEIAPWLHLTGDIQVIQNQNKSDDIAIITDNRLVVDF